MKRLDFRKSVVDHLVPHAKEDPRIVLLVCDMGFGVVDGFRKALPDRIFNVGIMEQGAVGIAAGAAMAGLVPVVYSIVNFLVYRAIEQVRNDVVLQGLNVKFIGTGADDYFKFLGRSHCCGKDDARLMKLLGLPVFDPYAAGAPPFPDVVRKWITSPRAGYLRV